MVDHIRARKRSSYSQNIWHKERWWAQIFAPHNDGTLPEHLCFLIQNETWGSIFPFLQQDKIPHYSVPMRKEHTQKNVTDRSLFPILHVSLSLCLQHAPISVLVFSNPPLLQLISWVSPNLHFFQPPILLQLFLTPLIHSSPPSLLPYSNSFPHKHLHIKLFV